METSELIAKLKQAEKATLNLKGCTDKTKRNNAIDALLLYIMSIREGLENEQTNI